MNPGRINDVRRLIAACVLVASSLGVFALSSGADPSPSPSLIVLSFDFSDNFLPASSTNGGFNVIADVLPAHSGGVVRMVAIAPPDSTATNLVCGFQSVQQSQVECAFNFSASGVWRVKAQFASARGVQVESVSITSLRVAG